jgi:hypothetical protein
MRAPLTGSRNKLVASGETDFAERRLNVEPVFIGQRL